MIIQYNTRVIIYMLFFIIIMTTILVSFYNRFISPAKIENFSTNSDQKDELLSRLEILTSKLETLISTFGGDGGKESFEITKRDTEPVVEEQDDVVGEKKMITTTTSTKISKRNKEKKDMMM